jgi:hypothetical protein
VWPGDRTDNKRRSAAAALELLLERVEASVGPVADGPGDAEAVPAASDPA